MNTCKNDSAKLGVIQAFRIVPGTWEMLFATPVVIVCIIMLELGDTAFALPSALSSHPICHHDGSARMWCHPCHFLARAATPAYRSVCLRLGNWGVGEKELKPLQLLVVKHLHWILFAGLGAGAVSFFFLLIRLLVAIIVHSQASE